MADSLTLPGPRVPLVDGRGLASLAWFQYFRSLSVTPEVTPAPDLSAYLPTTTVATGAISIRSTGTLASGAVTFQLVGDASAPGSYRYYGTDAAGVKGFHRAVPVAFESVSKNIASWDATYVYSLGVLDTITYTDGVETIVKTFGYTLGVLTSITLSGDTPGGIELVKTLTYTGADLTSVDYT